jgi:alkenylglycerophosphocholine hydrolase
MLSALTGAAALSAALAMAADWRDRPERRHRAFYVLKPLTTLVIFGIAAVAPSSTYQHWLLAALALSLAGDIFLMFGSDRAFVAGLASFLLAHLAFVTAFMQGVHAVALPGWLAAVVAYAVGLLVVLLPRAGKLKAAVLLYCAVLAAMVFAAAARHQALGDVDSGLAVAGALLFMLSDSLLGWRRFVGRYPGAQALILSTYWAAIGLIAWSA